jgi:hypothetical protein
MNQATGPSTGQSLFDARPGSEDFQIREIGVAGILDIEPSAFLP